MADAEVVSRSRRNQMPAFQIARRISRLIRDRKLSPGERLREQDLAKMFGVGRGPVREAFRLLEATGLLDVEPKRGVTIRRLTDREVVDNMVMAGFVSGLAARRVAEEASPEEKARIARRIRSFLDRAEEITLDQYIDEVVRCGDAIFRAAGSRVLTDQMRNIYFLGPGLVFAPVALATRPLVQRNMKEWERLRAAILDGDGAKAEHVARNMKKRAVEDALTVLGRAPLPISA